MMLSSLMRKFLMGGLLGLVLLVWGCGGNNDPVKSPGVGEDAPVMEDVPDPDKQR